MTAAVCDEPADAVLPLTAGGVLDLTGFYGQKLVIFFSPAGDPATATAEIAAYERLIPAFEASGAWVIGILPLDPDGAATVTGEHKLPIGIDPDGAGLRRLAERAFGSAAAGRNGATFVIDRDGRLRRGWDSCGHAAAALESVRERP